MKKSIPAFVAALLITTILASGMLLIGQDAIGTSTAAAAPVINASAAQQIQQVLVGYQTREIQYQAQISAAAQEISIANSQIDKANRQLQQYQSIMNELQSRGLITVDSAGTITIH